MLVALHALFLLSLASWVTGKTRRFMYRKYDSFDSSVDGSLLKCEKGAQE